MSFLNWEEQVKTTWGTNGTVYETYWELWDIPSKDREWYDYPKVTVYRVGYRKYELELADDKGIGALYFRSLKAAKAMGIVLTRME
jgi:hypothetical protein